MATSATGRVLKYLAPILICTVLVTNCIWASNPKKDLSEDDFDIMLVIEQDSTGLSNGSESGLTYSPDSAYAVDDEESGVILLNKPA